MAWSLILPLVFAAALIVLFAGWIFTRPKYQLDEVVHLVRKLDTAELARLLDPEEEWAMLGQGISALAAAALPVSTGVPAPHRAQC